jgi:hypothetical protein
MLSPAEPIRNLESVPGYIIQALENIGIEYVIQLVTMTKSQVMCIKGIDKKELELLSGVLQSEDLSFAQKPLRFTIQDMGPGKCSSRAEIDQDVFNGFDPVALKKTNAEEKITDVVVGVKANSDTGRIELNFSAPVLHVSFFPRKAVGLGELIIKKAKLLVN